MKEAVNDYEVKVVVLDAAGNVIAESETETIKVNHGFIARLIAFFRMLFRRLPMIEQ